MRPTGAFFLPSLKSGVGVADGIRTHKEHGMPKLTLTRKEEQRIIVVVPPSSEPTRIVVEMGRIMGERARIAIEAAESVRIDREEIAIEKGGA
jgi:sRNA-binding carbon storage regulator CsrA